MNYCYSLVRNVIVFCQEQREIVHLWDRSVGSKTWGLCDRNSRIILLTAYDLNGWKYIPTYCMFRCSIKNMLRVDIQYCVQYCQMSYHNPYCNCCYSRRQDTFIIQCLHLKGVVSAISTQSLKVQRLQHRQSSSDPVHCKELPCCLCPYSISYISDQIFVCSLEENEREREISSLKEK